MSRDPHPGTQYQKRTTIEKTGILNLFIIRNIRLIFCFCYQVTIHEFIDLLSRLVRGYPSHKIFSELSSLTNSDPEADILQNIRHIQLHRRTRALHRLSNVISEGKLSQATLTGYLLLLASNVVFSPLSAREHNLLSEAVNVLSAMAGQLQWSAYYHLLKHYLRQLSTRKEIHRNIIRYSFMTAGQLALFLSLILLFACL